MHAALLAVAVSAAATACASSGSRASSPGTPGTPAITKPAAAASDTAVADPLAGLTEQQVINRALADTEAARTVRIKGMTGDNGESETFDLILVHGKGCAGSISDSKVGSFKLVYSGSSVWLLPDKGFYQSQKAPASAVAILSGKYLKMKATSYGLGAMAAVCTLTKLLGGFSSASAAGSTREITSMNGGGALKFADAGDSAYLAVSDTASPKLLRVEAPGSGGSIDFSYPAATSITTPPASQVVDGSKYGF
jgi:hypothetical protein